MENMKFADLDAFRKHEVDSHFDIKIEKFRTAVDSGFRTFGERIRNSGVVVYVTAHPNRDDKDIESWLIVFTKVFLPPSSQCQTSYNIYSCILSIIDIEGKSRFPRSIERIPDDIMRKLPNLDYDDYTDAKYLQKSFILSRADELLPEGALTLRFEFYFDYNAVTLHGGHLTDRIYCNLFTSYIKREDGTVGAEGMSKEDEDNNFKVFDLTRQVLTLPQFHRSRERFGVLGSFLVSFLDTSDLKADSADNLDRIWIVDTLYGRFFLTFDEGQDGVGERLLEASPVVRRCVNSNMREQREKHIEFPKVTCETFSNVLYFLEKGMLSYTNFDKLLDIYKFSHLFEMEVLLRKCAEEMVKSLENRTDFEEVERIADLYADDYLSEQLESSRHEIENFGHPRMKTDDRPDFECYI